MLTAATAPALLVRAMSIRNILVASVLASTAALGCAHQAPGPVIASSAGQEGYAARYPDELSQARERFTLEEAKVRELTLKFSDYPGQLDKPDWNGVLVVVQSADQAGGSSAYVSRAREVENVRSFFKDEKEEIEKKVGGAANYSAKQKGCDVDAYSPTVHALETSMDKQLEKRMREHNEAQSYIEAHEDTLGKQNTDKLEQQADEIAMASYLARVGVVETKLELTKLIEDASTVGSTLDRSIKAEQDTIADAKSSDSTKKAAQARLDADQAAKGRLDAEVQQSKQAVQALEDRIKKLQSDYDQALSGLVEAIKKQGAS